MLFLNESNFYHDQIKSIEFLKRERGRREREKRAKQKEKKRVRNEEKIETKVFPRIVVAMRVRDPFLRFPQMLV